MTPITMILVDDHESIRIGLQKLLDQDKNTRFKLVGQANNGLDAVTLVEKLAPDIIILDLMMPGMNGLEVTKHLSQYQPQSKIIIFSMYSDDVYVVQAIKNGASGYVSKDAGPFELLNAVHEVHQGHIYYSHNIDKKKIEELITRSK